MEDTVALIDAIIAEHKVIFERLQSLESVANDAEALAGLEKAKGEFVPGRLDQRGSLKKLHELLEKTHTGLQAHFEREETALLTAFERHGKTEFVSALRALLLEHADIRNRFTQSREDCARLIGGGQSRHVWEASAHDTRAHITHTRKLVEAHARIEQELFHEVRKELKKAQPSK